MSTEDQVDAVLQAFSAGDWRLCLTRAALLLTEGNPPAPVLLAAAQSYSRLGHMPEAAHFYELAAELMPEQAQLLFTLAARIRAQLFDDTRALALLRRVQALGPMAPEALSTLRKILRPRLALAELARLDGTVHQAMLRGEAWAFDHEDPLFHLMWCGDEHLNGLVRHMPAGRPFTAEARAARRARPHRFGEKIRIGYLTNDVSDQHPTMILFQGVLEAHDPDRFDVTLFCYTDSDLAETDLEFRRRYPNLVDIRDLDDGAAADLIRARGIDILVDMKGHTRGARVDLVNRGLAPVQVAWLGFPGTCYGIDCDYIIGDPIVLPDGSEPYYHELFCRLPETYQCNDWKRRPHPVPSPRASLGLPEDKVVFGSFNKPAKITADVAALWARVLEAVPDSVLWVLCQPGPARENFVRHMQGLGIDPSRVIYMPRADYAYHLARMACVDIALDTFPYSGHTTTSDCLWVGVPVVALKGTNFASRVSESLLTAIGLGELVARDEQAFVDMAVAMARSPLRRRALKARIEQNRLRLPLFDTERFTRHLEAAYTVMAERAAKGLPPRAFDVPPLPPRQGPFA
ncbi:putative O-linked N-acetylglucosamine transferase (SPINDLY family) [Rhizobium aquaticum]|uniref:protein O-GlcNAc transferase n=1 Tax=Rhizobium aquaticum TaxID=1549636 RepID=A0ABV2IYK6_9HYPH